VLELPATGWLRRYRVRAHGDTDQAKLDALRGGVTIDGIEYAGIEARLDRQQGSNVWLTMGLREGKNREVKRVLEYIGLDVNRLIRISFGPFQLGELEEGGVEEIKTRILQDQLGEALAAEAKADFDAPVFNHTADDDDERPSRGRRDERARGPEPRSERVPQAERFEEAPTPRSERVQPTSRKHVKTMREERAEDRAKGGRNRIERNETADRKGRSVAVERVVPAGGRPGG
jgi:23S rRNA pseudouridine2605 synthase